MAEKPEETCGIAVENGVIEPDIDVVKAVGDGMDVEHLAIGDEQFRFACVKIDEKQSVVVKIWYWLI